MDNFEESVTVKPPPGLFLEPKRGPPDKKRNGKGGNVGSSGAVKGAPSKGKGKGKSGSARSAKDKGKGKGKSKGKGKAKKNKGKGKGKGKAQK